MRGLGEQLVVAAVYVFPWLVAACIVAGPAFFYVRKRYASKAQAA
jgi:hypothetical protein